MPDNKKIFTGVIFARGNSQGIKNKNLLKIKKISLVEHAVKQAYQTKLMKKVYISSDSKKIIKAAIKQKAIVPFVRPKRLSSNISPEILSWRHFVNYLKDNKIKTDYVVSVPTTSPLRKVSDIKKCIQLAKKNNFDIIFTITKASKNPFFNILIKKKNKLKLFNENKNIFYRRQDAPRAYDLTTVCYVFKPGFILKNNNLFLGKVGYVEVPKERSIDIDDKFDYKLTKILYKNEKD